MYKRLGEPRSPETLSIRCSIVGPEREPRGHLLAWLLGQPDGSVVQGHTDRIWSGVTTLQLAQFCRRLVETDLFDSLRARAPVVHFAPNLPLSKYELLEAAVRVYGRAIEVRPALSAAPIIRILQTRSIDLIGAYPPRPLSDALSDLRAAGPFHNTGKVKS